MSTREELEAERDYLLRSLDDLELERESGGIDDESFAALHDDYTARAAATIRALRDGADTRPARSKAPPARRRVAVVAVIVVLAIVAGVALATAVGVRLPGQTSSGNSPNQEASDAVGQRITALQKQVNANPDDYDLRLDLAEAYASNNDLLTALKQWDAAITIDPVRPEGHAQLGRALYLVSQQLPDKNAQAQYVAEARGAFDKAVEVGPDYADTYFFRGVLLAAIGEIARAQADLQTYLSKSPNGRWRSSASDALEQVTTALANPSTTVPASP